MARSNTNNNSKFDVLWSALDDESHGLALTDLRKIKSKTTGQVNVVLVFGDQAEVVMPGGWRIRKTEFPNGLYRGIKLDAWWEVDADGNQCFHLAPSE